MSVSCSADPGSLATAVVVAEVAAVVSAAPAAAAAAAAAATAAGGLVEDSGLSSSPRDAGAPFDFEVSTGLLEGS